MPGEQVRARQTFRVDGIAEARAETLCVKQLDVFGNPTREIASASRRFQCPAPPRSHFFPVTGRPWLWLMISVSRQARVIPVTSLTSGSLVRKEFGFRRLSERREDARFREFAAASR